MRGLRKAVLALLVATAAAAAPPAQGTINKLSEVAQNKVCSLSFPRWPHSPAHSIRQCDGGAWRVHKRCSLAWVQTVGDAVDFEAEIMRSEPETIGRRNTRRPAVRQTFLHFLRAHPVHRFYTCSSPRHASFATVLLNTHVL